MQRAALKNLLILVVIPALLLADDLDYRLRADGISFAPRNGCQTQINQLVSLLEQAVQQTDVGLLADILAEDIHATEADNLPAPVVAAL